MALIQVNYLSKALYRTVPLNVILPADKIDYGTGNYQMKEGERFQTLYLLHGLLGNYTDWVSGTRIQRWAEDCRATQNAEVLSGLWPAGFPVAG